MPDAAAIPTLTVESPFSCRPFVESDYFFVTAAIISPATRGQMPADDSPQMTKWSNPTNHQLQHEAAARVEGVVAKRKDAAYGNGWFKIRNPAYSQYEGRRELFEKRRSTLGPIV